MMGVLISKFSSRSSRLGNLDKLLVSSVFLFCIAFRYQLMNQRKSKDQIHVVHLCKPRVCLLSAFVKCIPKCSLDIVRTVKTSQLGEKTAEQQVIVWHFVVESLDKQIQVILATVGTFSIHVFGDQTRVF